MSVLQAFPCRCRLGDKQNAAVVEEEVSIRPFINAAKWECKYEYTIVKCEVSPICKKPPSYEFSLYRGV